MSAQRRWMATAVAVNFTVAAALAGFAVVLLVAVVIEYGMPASPVIRARFGAPR